MHRFGSVKSQIKAKKSDLNILGIIGARSGSKGVRGKNIKFLAGKPLMGWIINTARRSKYIDRLIVSTNSTRYARIARQFGAETPFLRPNELATNLTPELEYIRHALKWLDENENYKPDLIVRLLATVPLQARKDIDSCIEKLLINPEVDTAVVVAEARQHPQKAFKIAGDRLIPYIGERIESIHSNRQSCEKAYFRANIVACRSSTLKKRGSMYGNNVAYHIIPQERAIDIDTPTDFLLAEQLVNLSTTKRR